MRLLDENAPIAFLNVGMTLFGGLLGWVVGAMTRALT
jgi:hypothetical protein